jgi:hypothetical protein
LQGLHRRFVFAVIDRDFIDNFAIDSDLRVVVAAMARSALRRSDQPIARLHRQARPRARAYHRSSYRLPPRRPFGPPRRRHWSMLPAANAPSQACMPLATPAVAPTRALLLRRPFGL